MTALQLIFVLLTFDTQGGMIVKTELVSPDLCQAKMSILQADKPTNQVGWCAMPGQAFRFDRAPGS